MLSVASERPQAQADSGMWTHDWVVTFDPAGNHAASGSPASLLRLQDASSLLKAEDDQLVVLFAGTLVNARELDRAARAADAAELVLAAFRRDGFEAFGRLRGLFAVLILERGPRRLWAVRLSAGPASRPRRDPRP
jgi:asparagine synthetase B (glutamine-hydrolysing)